MPWWFMASWEHLPCGTVFTDRSVPPLNCDFCITLLVRVTKHKRQGWRKIPADMPLRQAKKGRIVANPKARRPKRGHRNISPNLRKRVYARDGYACVECGARKNLTCDHRIPWSKGGRTTYENLQTMCKPCNVAKADTEP